MGDTRCLLDLVDYVAHDNLPERGHRPDASSTVLTMSTHWTLGCDANDPHRLAKFWAKALGYISEPGYDNPDGASIIDPDGRKAGDQLATGA